MPLFLLFGNLARGGCGALPVSPGFRYSRQPLSPARLLQDKITIVKWWVSDSDSNSIRLFEKDVAKYSSIKYVFLKNMGRRFTASMGELRC